MSGKSESDEVRRTQSGLRVDKWIATAAKKAGDVSTADQADARVRDGMRSLAKYN